MVRIRESGLDFQAQVHNISRQNLLMFLECFLLDWKRCLALIACQDEAGAGHTILGQQRELLRVHEPRVPGGSRNR